MSDVRGACVLFAAFLHAPVEGSKHRGRAVRTAPVSIHMSYLAVLHMYFSHAHKMDYAHALAPSVAPQDASNWRVV